MWLEVTTYVNKSTLLWASILSNPFQERLTERAATKKEVKYSSVR